MGCKRLESVILRMNTIYSHRLRNDPDSCFWRESNDISESPGKRRRLDALVLPHSSLTEYYRGKRGNTTNAREVVHVKMGANIWEGQRGQG